MSHGKQAKMLTPKQETAVLTYLRHGAIRPGTG